MLGFFRRYQRILFILITGVIIVSFSFFGTYGSIGESTGEDPIAFHTIDGQAVTLSGLNKMMRFCASDAVDAMQYSEGPNFLNDGIIRKDFLETGFAAEIASAYKGLLAPDLQLRADREKRYTPYSHPGAPFLGADAAWSHFAPEIKQGFEALKDTENPLAREAFEKRIKLYLAEAKFPQQALKQVLQFQQSQYEWLRPDPYLARRDLALFGYHSLEDWFGQRFLAVACELIINGSVLAREKGYEVSAKEALADLMRNAEMSFLQKRSSTSAANSTAYLQDQLRMLGLSRKDAVVIWQQVLLFRRLFHDVGNTALLDSFAFDKFHAYAAESADVEIVALPEAFCLRDYAALQAFECYADAIANEREDLPTQLRPLAEIEKETPELIVRQYTVDVAKLEKSALRREIPIKQVWDWELEKKNWWHLAKKFPVLAASHAKNRTERFEALSSLDKPTRARLDLAASNQMLERDEVESALARIETDRVTIRIPLRGGSAPLPGLNDREEFLKQLEQDQFICSSDDGEILYSIAVINRDAPNELLSFAEAKEKGVLKGIVMRRLRQHHKTMETETPFDRDQVADDLFASLLTRIYESYEGSDRPQMPTGEFAAHHRFDRYLQEVQAHHAPKSLEQFQLVRNNVSYFRGESSEFDPFEMEIGATSSILGGKEKSSFFVRLLTNNPGEHQEDLQLAAKGLFCEAQSELMKQLINEVNGKEAVSLAWLE